MPMGVNRIGSLMKTISKAARLSKEYTGHCIRSSVVTNLFNKGIAIDEIACVTGHKESNSVKRYLRHVSDEKKTSFATALNSSFNDEASSSTVCTVDNHDCKYSQYFFLEFTTYILTITTTFFFFLTPFKDQQRKKMVIDADGNANRIRITFE